MRLIDVNSLRLKEVSGPDALPYAILSHTWDDTEVSFQEMQDLENARSKAGFTKILNCCQQAKKDGWNWVWIDSCCIDKRSSAELSEAINSMFDWYASSTVCYVHLGDVDSKQQWLSLMNDGKADDMTGRLPRWMRRGWTLQEMIAPLNLQFFTNGWRPLGSKAQWKSELFRLTGVDPRVLVRTESLSNIAVATKMHWAAGRETTREEDRAYSLLGIFNLTMPLMYGEGPRAFQRLQEELLEETEDQTLFMHSLSEHSELKPSDPYKLLDALPQDGTLWPVGAMLAESPDAFSMAPQFQPVFTNRFPDARLTSRERGLQMNVLLARLPQHPPKVSNTLFNMADVYLAGLNCASFSQLRKLAHIKTNLNLDLAQFGEASFWNDSSSLARYDSDMRIAILLQKLTHRSSRAAIPTFARIGSFYTIVDREDMISWNFGPCYIVQQTSYTTSVLKHPSGRCSSQLPYTVQRVDDVSSEAEADSPLAAGYMLEAVGPEGVANYPFLSVGLKIQGTSLSCIVLADEQVKPEDHVEWVLRGGHDATVTDLLASGDGLVYGRTHEPSSCPGYSVNVSVRRGRNTATRQLEYVVGINVTKSVEECDSRFPLYPNVEEDESSVANNVPATS
ncbi:heterokaryon incompatibility protein-domain-containing protein [Xylariomycetidae sp. FL0641]|nr:heterokaryon incompatibility protein-domain-containing protein [Xylariomycetidae sp. FL0641]